MSWKVGNQLHTHKYIITSDYYRPQREKVGVCRTWERYCICNTETNRWIVSWRCTVNEWKQFSIFCVNSEKKLQPAMNYPVDSPGWLLHPLDFLWNQKCIARTQHHLHFCWLQHPQNPTSWQRSILVCSLQPSVFPVCTRGCYARNRIHQPANEAWITWIWSRSTSGSNPWALK